MQYTIIFFNKKYEPFEVMGYYSWTTKSGWIRLYTLISYEI